MAESGGSVSKLAAAKFGKKTHSVSGGLNSLNGTSMTVSSSNEPPSDKKGPKEGVPLNKKASGGTVRTWMPSSKTERDKLSDKMADKVLGNLSDLDLPGKKKKVPSCVECLESIAR
eukprot:jgi/Bigna1/142650/aug1.72_g17358